jgi:thiamine biosynthesis lipoprotein
MTATFRAMTTEIAVQAPTLEPAAEAALALRAAALFEASERIFSRFRDDSELGRLNRAPGPARVSEHLFDVLRKARAHAERTGGAFDPGVGAAMVAAGYDRSFSPGALDREAPPNAPPARASILEIGLDEATRTVHRPAGALIDLGGMVKGWTVDRAAALLPVVSALDAGGDAVLRGSGPEGEGWIVEIEDPRDPSRVVLSLRARDRAVATSAANRRRWRAGALDQHHLIDPRTGKPAATDLAQATVLAPSAELADVLAKAVFVLGSREGARLLARFEGVGGVLVLAAGSVRVVGDVEVMADV